MKKMKNYKNSILAIGLALGLSACTNDFEDVNTNRYGVTEEMLKWDNVNIGGSFVEMEKAVIRIGTAAETTGPANDYQLTDNLAGDCWSGYFSQNNNWNGGSNNTTYFLIDGWINGAFGNSYRKIFTPWLAVKRKSEKSKTPELFALAQILKISAWHRATDMFGPIPYKGAGQGSLKVAYNSQKEVYTEFFKDLTSAIKELSSYATTSTSIIPEYDAVYNGNVNQWIKYANSLMLRLAIRVSYADPAMAKKYAEQAVTHPMGVMTTASDAAKMNKGAGFVFRNPVTTLSDEYNETRMSPSMYSFLKGYKDPRLSKYFKQGKYEGKSDYYAIPSGNIKSKNDIYKDFSRPNIGYDTPLYWIKTSEVLFLKAEGALKGWNMGGDAKTLYEQAVKMSFEENGVGGVDDYLKNKTNQPIDYIDPSTTTTYAKVSNITVPWDDATSNEKKLEKIITQKWLAIYPNGQEAWSEYRRTGYPKLIPVANNKSGGVIDSDKGVRRMKYPSSEYTNNAENIQKAIGFLKGTDSGATKLWWDAK